MPETKKKMTTGGFFRAGLRWALGGGTGENPVTTVIKEGLKAQEDEGKTVIETTIEESDHGRQEKAP